MRIEKKYKIALIKELRKKKIQKKELNQNKNIVSLRINRMVLKIIKFNNKKKILKYNKIKFQKIIVQVFLDKRIWKVYNKEKN